MAFEPRFTITNAITAALTEIERAGLSGGGYARGCVG